MAPSRIVRLKLRGRQVGPESSRTEDPVASSDEDDHNTVISGKAGKCSNQSRSSGMTELSSPPIKQEPSFGTTETISAPTSNMKETCDTKSATSAAEKKKRSMSSCYRTPNHTDSSEIDNGSGHKTMNGEPLHFANDNDNKIDFDASNRIAGPSEGADISEPDQQTTNIKANAKTAKKGPNGAKRKAESKSNEGPPTKNKPAAYRKPRKHALEAAKYLSHANSLVLSGKKARLPKDIDRDLPTICQAPTEVREHLKALEKAGLKLSHAKSGTIRTHVKVLSGLCHAFQNITPCLIERDGEPRVDDFKWELQGLNHPLHSHQMLGSAIMIILERDENQGSGLLLDFMGFGKTVQTLACIVTNRVRQKKNGKRLTDGSATTLVVVPKSAATQWVEEVKRHTKPQLSVMLWTRQTEITRGSTLAADILVVTYEQVRAMHKTKKASSLLFDVCYQRIVLDEAHRIKNRDSESFKACMSLNGKHRWALTGTPIPNGVHELYPLLKFIRHPSVKDFADFKLNYLTKRRGAKPEGAAEYEGLSEILLPTSIMRTPGHQFCGIPLVNLPQDHAIKEFVPLSAEEKVIEKYLNMFIMSYIKMKCGGTSNYFCLMERFLRFRQFSASPLLLEGPVKCGLWPLNVVRDMKEEAHNTGIEQTPFIDTFERWIVEPKRDHLAPTGDRKIDSTIAKVDNKICPLCSKTPKKPLLADCGHIWCEYCVTMWQKAREAIELEKSCPKCEQLIGEVRPHNPEEANDHDKDETGSPEGVDHNGFQPADDEGSTLFHVLDQHPETPIPLSAKMKRMLDLILEWQGEAPKDKIIGIYCLPTWTDFIR